MGGEEDIFAAASLPDERSRLLQGVRVHPGERLVQQEGVTLGPEGAQEGGAPLLAAGELRRIGIHAVGKAHQIQDGKDVVIIANGDTVRLAIEAAKVLEGKGISARVLDMHTIKPLDVEAVTAAINEVGKIITVEDHNILNGLGSAVCEVAAEMGKGIVKRVGIQDQFGQSAPYERLLAMNGVTVENITEIAETLVKG